MRNKRYDTISKLENKKKKAMEIKIMLNYIWMQSSTMYSSHIVLCYANVMSNEYDIQISLLRFRSRNWSENWTEVEYFHGFSLFHLIVVRWENIAVFACCFFVCIPNSIHSLHSSALSGISSEQKSGMKACRKHDVVQMLNIMDRFWSIS